MAKTTIRLGVTTVTSPLEVGADQAPRLLQQVMTALSYDGELVELCPSPQPVVDPDAAVEAGRFFYDQRVDAICAVAASWFEDYLLLDLLEEHSVPVICWGRPGMETGSLCGMQQLAYMLKALGHPHLFLFDRVDSDQARRRVLDYALAAATRRRLRRARIGYLGHRVEGMTETTPHELALKKDFGARVVGIDTRLYQERLAQVPTGPLRGRWQRLADAVGDVAVPDETGLQSLQAHQVLLELIEEHGLSAVAIGCYPDLMGIVCLAASLLGEAGIPLACEGDVNGALAMLILTWLTGEPIHNTDVLDPIPEENALVFSHCGSGGFSLAERREDITLGPVRLMDQGLCCLFVARPGPVTLLNLVPTLDGRYRMGVLYGEAKRTEMVFPGNPLKVQFDVPYADVIEWIAAQGLGHHWMAAYGDLRPPLRHLADLVGCEWHNLT